MTRFGRRALGVTWLFVAACSRDLNVPEPLGAGEVIGRVLVAVPGRDGRQPAHGATVQLSSSSHSVTAGEDGRFRLTGITSRDGSLLVSYASAETGVRQKRLSLEAVGAGPGRIANVGDVLVVESAAVHGKALRGDVLPQRSGHLNSVVFVPEGPVTAYTADDGTFALTDLPEGPLQLSVFREGYEAATLSQLVLRSGEDFPLKDIVLTRMVGTPRPGAIVGAVRLVPEAAIEGTTIDAVKLGGAATRGTVSGDGTFSVLGLDPGIYDLIAQRAGYSSAVVPNVLVRSDQATTVREVVLGTGVTVAVDAGRPEPYDAGIPDAGPPDAGPPDAGPPDAGPPDAGPPDAGRPDAGPLTCVMNLDCPIGSWCDDRLCVPQCASSGDCTNNRVCDPSSRTCITPCDGGCPTGLSCDVPAGVCRQPCDAFAPCPPGQKCSSANRCVAECMVAADCPSPHLTCQNGQCGPTGSCDSDLDCPSTQRCLGLPNGVCQTRPVADAGVDGGLLFACASGCDCRAGEACVAGACRFEGLPTVVIAADAGGPAQLVSVLADAGPGTFVALRAGDVFTLDAGLSITSSRVALAGGYVDCGGRGWRRDEAQLTELVYASVPVVRVAGTAIAPVDRVVLRNLELTTGNAACGVGVLSSASTRNEEVENVLFTAVAGCTGGGLVGAVCSSCSELHLRRVQWSPHASYGTQTSWQLASLGNISGLLEDLTMPSTVQPGVIGLNMGSLVGPLTVRRMTFSPVTGTGHAFAITFSNCGNHRLTIENSHIVWPLGGTITSGLVTTMDIRDCNDLVVRDNHFDGSPVVGGMYIFPRGLALANVAGLITRNRFDLPAITNPNNGVMSGLQVNGSRGPLTISENTFAGGNAGGAIRHIELLGLNVGPTRVERNVIIPSGVATSSVGAGAVSAGLLASGVQPAAQLKVTDNVLHSAELPSCVGIASGAHLINTTATLERNQLYGRRGNSAHGLTVEGGSSVELYSNYAYGGVSTARPTCSPAATTGSSTGLNINVDGGQPFVHAVGNTFEGAGDPAQVMPAIGVSIPAAGNFSAFVSNLIGGGRAPSHPMLVNDSPGTTWEGNYFWYAHPGPRTAGDHAPDVAADAGSNVVGDRAGCYDLSQPHPTYRLAPAGPCIDTGTYGRRLDLSILGTDLEGKGRDGGAGPDIGAWERP